MQKQHGDNSRHGVIHNMLSLYAFIVRYKYDITGINQNCVILIDKCTNISKLDILHDTMQYYKHNRKYK